MRSGASPPRRSPREELGDAGIAPVVHVQFVRRDEGLERHMPNLVPIAHDREAAKQIDILLLGGDARSDPPCPASPAWRSPCGTYCMSISTTSAPACLELRDAVAQQDGVRPRADDRAAPSWCRPARARDRDARRSRRRRTAPASRRLLAVDAAIEHRDLVSPGTCCLELDGKAARIARRRRACAGAVRRGRADGDDGQRLAAGEAPRGARQRMDETRELRGGGAGGRSAPRDRQAALLRRCSSRRRSTWRARKPQRPAQSARLRQA